MKNDLEVDAVSRKSVLAIIQNHWWNCRDIDKLVNELPSVTPQEPKIVPIAEIKFDEDKLKELVNKAILKVMPQEMGWIPVSKEMPEEKINVLVTLKSGEIGILRIIEVEDENGYPCYRWMDYEGDIDYEVIAWMPLPEPYKGDAYGNIKPDKD